MTTHVATRYFNHTWDLLQNRFYTPETPRSKCCSLVVSVLLLFILETSHNQSTSWFGLKPRALWRHDAVCVSNLHDLLNRNWVKGKGKLAVLLTALL